MKKRTFYLGGAALVAVVTFMFASCSQEDDFIINNGLDIDSQVPMTRSEPGDGYLNPDKNKLTRIDAYSCCILSILNCYRNNNHGRWEDGECAQDEYDKIMYYAEHTLHYEKGKPMSNDMFAQLAEHYNYAGHVCGNDMVVEYFDNHKNGNKMVYYYVYNEQTGKEEGHWATVSSFDSKPRKPSESNGPRKVRVYDEQGRTVEIYMSDIRELRYYQKPKK